jgi:carbonic anhydrase
MPSERVRQGHQMGFLERAYQGTSHDADALILTCIDFRFPHQIVDYMDSLRSPGKPRITYDHVILAGASLGVFSGVFPQWGAMFWDHLAVSIKLHNIKQVYLIDHCDCGGYREFGALPSTDQVPAGSETERQIHQHYMDRLAYLIRNTHKELEVITHLLDLPGETSEKKPSASTNSRRPQPKRSR